MADEEMTRAEEIAKRASDLAARAEELSRHAHEVAGVDEQLAALEAELDGLIAEEDAVDAGIAGESAEEPADRSRDAWTNVAEALAERMEALGDRLGDLISGTVDSALHTATMDPSPFGRSHRGPTQLKESEAEIPVAGALPVRVRSGGGSVEIRKGRTDRVHVAWRVRGRLTADDPELVTVQERDGAVVIESVGRRGWRPSVTRIEVEVPVHSPVDVVTGGGSVKIEGTRSTVRARTGGGSITIADADGEVDATTGGGRVRVDGRLTGQSTISTGGGAIDVTVSADTCIDIDATGTPASIDVPGLNLQGFHVSGAVRGGGEGELRVRTGGGRARISQA
jgi:hypothetical protein